MADRVLIDTDYINALQQSDAFARQLARYRHGWGKRNRKDKKRIGRSLHYWCRQVRHRENAIIRRGESPAAHIAAHNAYAAARRAEIKAMVLKDRTATMLAECGRIGERMAMAMQKRLLP